MTQLSAPLTFKHGATLTNRFVQSPMLTNSGKDGYATQDTIDYYAAHAQAGSMIITEYMYVAADGGPALSWRNDREQLAVYDDRFVPQLRKVATALKSAGNKAVMQIADTGIQANGRILKGLPVYGPSGIDFPFLPYKVHALSTDQVEQIIASFGAAVKRAVAAGFDGVEIHGANHYLIQQFFSQNTNQRTDHWGGSLAKRMNFPLAVVKSVVAAAKKYAPRDFIIGYRISPEEIHGQAVGYTWHEATRLVKTITSQFDLDYVHLSLPRYDAKPADSDRTFAELFRPFLGAGIKEIIVGGINNRVTALAALAHADLVAVGKENIIDPLFATKILAGQDDQVVDRISPDQARQNSMTPGMLENFSAAKVSNPLPGGESLRALHKVFGAWSEMPYPANGEMK